MSDPTEPIRRRRPAQPTTGSILGVRDCGALVLLFVATDEGELLPVPLDRWSCRWLLGWEGCGLGELVGSRTRYGGGRIVSLDGEGPT
jgi:hypothetical protein